MLRNSIKEDLKENFISEEEYWQYNKEYSDKIKKIKEDIQLYEEEKETIKNNDTDWMNIFKKKEKINELNRLLIDELIEDIVIEKDNNLKIIFKCEDDDNLGEILSQAEMTCRKNKEFSDVAIIIDKSPGMIN